jgi:hypothetical protein
VKRFRFVLLHLKKRALRVGGLQRFGKDPLHRKKLASPRDPLKRNKSDKEIFGKAWQKAAFFWKSLENKFGKSGRFMRNIP